MLGPPAALREDFVVFKVLDTNYEQSGGKGMGRVTRKTIAAVLAVLSLCALLLSGCKKEPGSSETEGQTEAVTNSTVITEPSDPKDVFWIVMDKTVSMTSLVEKLIDTFQSDHPELQVELQVIPTYYFQSDKDKRDAVLQEIRTAMAEGNGPDVFLLPAAQKNGEPLLWEKVSTASASYVKILR